MELSLSKHVNVSKIRKGDEVMVINGRSRGVSGTVERIDNKNYRVFVAGANLFKKHQKPDTKNPDGGIVDKSMSIHLSNVMLIDPKTKKPTRVGYQLDANGKKIRVAKKSGTPL